MKAACGYTALCRICLASTPLLELHGGACLHCQEEVREEKIADISKAIVVPLTDEQIWGMA